MDWPTTGVIITGLSLVSVIIGAAIAFGQWKGKVDSDRDTFKRTLDAFMSEIRSDIKQIFKNLSPSVISSGSPLQLTDLGKRVSDIINGTALADSLVGKLREEAAGKLPYEIQEMAKRYVHEDWKLPADIRRAIMSAAYENGLKREQVLDVIAIELRDKLLQEENL